jgi:hypothetical protein
VIALGAQAGKGGDAVSNGCGDCAADDGCAEAAAAGAGGVDPPAQGCGARAHVGGSRDAASAALAGAPGGVVGLVGFGFSTVTSTAVFGVGCPGSSHPSPNPNNTAVPCNSPWTMQVYFGPEVPPPLRDAEHELGRLPPAECTTAVRLAKVLAMLVLPVRQASAIAPHAVNVGS